jgi:hypothetical protein
MAKLNFDGVVQAVHYQADGLVDWVRIYLRRGPTFSDRTMLDRQALIAQLKVGKRYFAGQRIQWMASSFKLSEPLRVIEKNGREFIVTGGLDVDQDRLEGVPII